MSCAPPTVTVGGIIISTSPFENARELINRVGGPGDPTFDEYEENIARGNNTSGKSGILVPNTSDGEPPKQTTLPGEISEEARESSDKPAGGGSGTRVGCIMWNGNYNAQLSPNLKLTQFTMSAHWPWPLIDFGGYNKQARFCNLQNLAVNIGEPLLKKFGPFLITSGLRNKTSASANKSQHTSGEAADFQFPGWSYSRYWEAAHWVRDNLPFDQFLFEHGQSPWLHLSFRAGGGRAPGARDKVMTMYRNQFSPGLKRYG